MSKTDSDNNLQEQESIFSTSEDLSLKEIENIYKKIVPEPNVNMTSENIDDKTARVTCEGYILLDYGQEQNELPLGTYQVVNQNDEWKWCGEAE